MGFEVQKAFKMETRRLLWLIGLLFATVILFQGVELPKGSSVFSRSENPEKRISSFFSDNVTSPSIALVVKNPELAVPSENGTSKNTSSFVATEGKDHALSPGQNGDFTPYAAVPPVAPRQPTVIASALNSSFMRTEKDDTTLPLAPGQNGNFSSYVALPPVAPPQPAGISSTLNSSFAGTEKEDTALHPGQNGNFTPYIAAPPVAPAPMVSSVIRAPLQTSELNSSTASTTPQVDSLSLQNASLSPPLVHMPVQKPKPKPTPISKMPPKDVYTLSDMNEMLIQSQMSPDTRVCMSTYSNSYDSIKRILIASLTFLMCILDASMAYECRSTIDDCKIRDRKCTCLDKRRALRPPISQCQYVSEVMSH